MGFGLRRSARFTDKPRDRHSSISHGRLARRVGPERQPRHLLRSGAGIRSRVPTSRASGSLLIDGPAMVTPWSDRCHGLCEPNQRARLVAPTQCPVGLLGSLPLWLIADVCACACHSRASHNQASHNRPTEPHSAERTCRVCPSTSPEFDPNKFRYCSLDRTATACYFACGQQAPRTF